MDALVDTSSLLKELQTGELDDNKRKVVFEGGVLSHLVKNMRESRPESLQSLEIIYYLSLDHTNRPKLASQTGLVDSVKSLSGKGRLKQKKVALAAFRNLQDFAENKERESTSSLADVTNTSTGPRRSARLVGKRGFNGTAARRARGKPSGQTYSLYVENLENEDVRKKVEDCVLAQSGTVSVFSNMKEGQIVVRTTKTYEDVALNIFKKTSLRSTMNKGDYSGVKYPQYVEESNNGGWFSGLMSMIVVKRDTPAPSSGGGGGGGWWGGSSTNTNSTSTSTSRGWW